MRMLRKLYDWVLSWAYTPYGTLALFLIAFAEASFFPIPPDVLLIALCIALPTRSFRFALIASAGSVSGGCMGYVIGIGLWEAVSGYFFLYIPGFTETSFARVQRLFAIYDFWAVFTAGFTPIPYKIITIGAGVFKVNFAVFLVASCISRSLRFFLVAWLIHRYGPAMRDFIEKYFNVLTLIFMILLIGGFIIIKYLF